MGDPSDDAPDAIRGTYLVTHAEPGSAVLKEVESGQVHTLADGERIEANEVLTATLAPVPPLEVTWRVVDVHDRGHVDVEVVEEPPTRQTREEAAGRSVGELAREPRAGTGELHVVPVAEGEAAAAARDVAADEATRVRAARMDGVERVEIRHADGVVSVRYLP